MAVDTIATQVTAKTMHPIYKAMVDLWTKWRLAYEGGDPFKDKFVYQYSRKENKEDFLRRRMLTYVPGHAKTVINIIRNAIAVRLPDVVRDGSEQYMQTIDTNVDGFNNNMNTFIALDVCPLLLVHGKRYVVVDAPAASDGATIAEDSGVPYFYTVGAEDVLSWSYDANGNIRSILMRLYEDVEDPQSRLITDVNTIYRLMLRLEPGESYADSTCGTFDGPGVLVKTFDNKGELTEACRLMPWTRVPVAEFRLVDSVMKDIVDHQVALLNLTSTDMDFLWRGNFPLYTQQQGKGHGTIRPRGTKADVLDPMNTSYETVDGVIDPKKDQNRATHGIGKGISYPEGTERPDFIAPSTDNLKASMEKQQAIITEIRVLVDLALVSLSVRAVEQSGKSKEADRVGEEAGLSYIGRALEGGERDLNELWHMMAGIESADMSVQYPSGYSIKTQDERIAEARSLRELRSAVRSEKFQKLIDQRVSEIILKPIASQEELNEVITEADKAVYFDDDKSRADVVQKDVALKIVSKATGAAMRGYDPAEVAKVDAESVASANAIANAAGSMFGAGGETQAEEDDEEDEDVTDATDEGAVGEEE